MEELLRRLIVERIRMGCLTSHWQLDVYSHLLGHGASPGDAIRALSAFVDEAIAMKERQHEPTVGN